MKIAVQSGRTVEELGPATAYKLYKECGFEAIDWNINNSLSVGKIKSGEYKGKCIFEKDMDEILEYYQEELDELKKNGLTIAQAHAIFPSYVTGHPETLDYIIELHKKMIAFCDIVGCKYLVVHGICYYKDNYSETLDEINALNYKLYSGLIPALQNSNVVVCLENLFARSDKINYVEGHCSNPYEAVELIDKLNCQAGKECFGLCLDTGHLNLLRIDCRRYIPVLGKRIKTLHIHDNDGVTDQHKAPYTGTFNWKAFCKELAKIGYDGDIGFETFMQTSLEVIDEEMLTPWFRLIFECGNHFRNIISKK